MKPMYDTTKRISVVSETGKTMNIYECNVWNFPMEEGYENDEMVTRYFTKNGRPVNKTSDDHYEICGTREKLKHMKNGQIDTKNAIGYIHFEMPLNLGDQKEDFIKKTVKNKSGQEIEIYNKKLYMWKYMKTGECLEITTTTMEFKTKDGKKIEKLDGTTYQIVENGEILKEAV